MTKSTLIALIGVLIFGFALAWWIKDPEVIYQTNEQQKQIDSLSVVISNQRTTKDALLDSLENTTEEFQEYIDNYRGEVASLTRIKGQLNLKVDSLSMVNNRLSALALLSDSEETVFKDTTLSFTTIFGDSLIEGISETSFENDSLSNEMAVNQLRDVRLDLAILVSDDRRLVESVATSPDFRSLNISAQTTIKPPRRKFPWYGWVASGILISQGIMIFTK